VPSGLLRTAVGRRRQWASPGRMITTAAPTAALATAPPCSKRATDSRPRHPPAAPDHLAHFGSSRKCSVTAQDWLAAFVSHYPRAPWRATLLPEAVTGDRSRDEMRGPGLVRDRGRIARRTGIRRRLQLFEPPTRCRIGCHGRRRSATADLDRLARSMADLRSKADRLDRWTLDLAMVRCDRGTSC
jgi:hypothetical protein